MAYSSLKRIGFLATQFDEYYQNLVFGGALEQASMYPVQLLFYEGSNTDTLTKAGELDDTAFNLAAKTKLDGLVIMANTMGSSYSRNRIEGYLSSFSHIPSVSIGVEFFGMHTLVADTTGGMTQITAHLYEVHQRRRFLFVAGPEGHPESEQRKTEFLDTLRSLMPSANPTVVYADFLEERAYEMVQEVLRHSSTYDAVVCANDQMAFGAIRALEERSLHVPAQVSVTGFDDIPYSTLSVPALTTIHQPTKELGRRAIEYLADKLGLATAQSKASVSDLSSAFVIRQSCGCVSDSVDETLLEESALQIRLRNLFSLQISERSRSGVLRRIEAAMVRSFSLEDILSEFSQGLKRLHIHFAAVVMFDTQGKTIEWSDLIMLYREQTTRVLAPYGLKFPTNQLLPDGLPSQYRSYVCEPLQFGSEQIGYFICTPDATDLHVYATLRDILTTSIKGALVMNLEKDREFALEKEVLRRTSELSAINKQLKTEVKQRKLLEQELLEISNNIMTRIGQDIHDDLCQDLAGLGMLAATLESALQKTNHAHERQLAKAISDSALKSAYTAKQIARNLYPSDLEENGIIVAVTQLVKERTNPVGIKVELEVQEDFYVNGKEKAFHLYRIIQEALSNALHHADASHILVGLYHDHDMVTVKVEDDGVGFELKKGKAGSGMGLKILTYRANLIGGKLRIQSSKEGTSVTCRIPQ
ncbi:substrate-binding domain-containing protein [Sphaerochaeta sp.]|uniref:substrate-binding domain-containing protein n=1 Tax=Sphaerochaeta sp. TaxID=1972642 RepID=UPI003D0FA956